MTMGQRYDGECIDVREDRTFEIGSIEARVGAAGRVAGLGTSPMAERYAIRSEAEARTYPAHPALGPNLYRCVDALLAHDPLDPHAILGSPDEFKLRSSTSLFEAVGNEGLFGEVLEGGTGRAGRANAGGACGVAGGSVRELPGV